MRSRCAQEVINSRSYGMWKFAKNCENRVFDRYFEENFGGIPYTGHFSLYAGENSINMLIFLDIL